MLRYFVAGNLWLAASLALVLGGGFARTSPSVYTVFGVGWIDPWAYRAVVLVGLGLAALWLGAWAATRPGSGTGRARRTRDLPAG